MGNLDTRPDQDSRVPLDEVRVPLIHGNLATRPDQDSRVPCDEVRVPDTRARHPRFYSVGSGKK